MATASLTTSPTQIDAGSSDNVSVTNTGTVDVTVARGAQSFTLRPTQARVVYPEGVAVTAATVSGSGSVSYTATAARLSQQAQFAADPTFTGTYAPLRFLKPYGSIVCLGDSIVTSRYLAYAIGGTLVTGPSGANSTVTGSHIDAGVASNTTAQMLARFDTDVTPYAPKTVFLLSGTNDAGNSTTVAAFAANVRSIIGKIRGIGAIPILGTVPPTSNTTPANRNQLVRAYNQWLVRYAISQGIRVVDYWSALVDPTTGAMLTSYQFDNIHPNSAGVGAMIGAVKAMLAAEPTYAMLLPTDGIDTKNYIRNPLFLNGASGSIPTNWSRRGSLPTGETLATLTGDSNIKGNWFQISQSAGSGASEFAQTNTVTAQDGTAYAGGHKYAGIMRITSTALSTGQTYTPFIRQYTDGTYDIRWGTIQLADNQPGGVVLYGETAAPTSGTTGIQTDILLAAGTGNVAIAQCGVWDLTDLGVVDANGALV